MIASAIGALDTQSTSKSTCACAALRRIPWRLRKGIAHVHSTFVFERDAQSMSSTKRWAATPPAHQSLTTGYIKGDASAPEDSFKLRVPTTAVFSAMRFAQARRVGGAHNRSIRSSDQNVRRQRKVVRSARAALCSSRRDVYGTPRHAPCAWSNVIAIDMTGRVGYSHQRQRPCGSITFPLPKPQRDLATKSCVKQLGLTCSQGP